MNERLQQLYLHHRSVPAFSLVTVSEGRGRQVNRQDAV